MKDAGCSAELFLIPFGFLEGGLLHSNSLQGTRSTIGLLLFTEKLPRQQSLVIHGCPCQRSMHVQAVALSCQNLANGGKLSLVFPQTVYCWGSILERTELATLTGRAPELCGWALWLTSVAGLCGWALSSSCPPLGRAPELCQLCGWALWLGLVLLLAAPLNSVNSVAGLGWALSSFCPPLGRAPELCQLCGWALSSSWPRP